MLKNTYSVIDESTKDKIRAQFKVTEDSIKRDVNIIKEWIKQQAHFPQETQDDDLIEKWLSKNKFQVEVTKKRIEDYYTFKAIHVGRVEKIRSTLPVKTTLMVLPLPLLTDKQERIILIKVKSDQIDDDELVWRTFKLSLCVAEYSLRCDYSAAHRIIQDFEGLTKEQIKKYTVTLASITKPYVGAYFGRVSALELLNVPPTVAKFLDHVKPHTSEKIFSRISIHKNFESLHKNIDRAYLPPELGGTLETSIPEILDTWNEEIKNNLEVLENLVAKEISSENLRIGELTRLSDIFGADGTFKSLSID